MSKSVNRKTFDFTEYIKMRTDFYVLRGFRKFVSVPRLPKIRVATGMVKSTLRRRYTSNAVVYSNSFICRSL